MTAWIDATKAPGGKKTYQRALSVVELQNGLFLVRTWARFWELRLESRVFSRKKREFRERPNRRPVRGFVSWSEELRRSLRRRSFVLEIYRLGRSAGQGRLESLLSALKWRRDARKWRKIKGLADNRTPKTEKRLYEALKRAPKLFEGRIR